MDEKLIKEERNKYYKEWRAKNKDKVKEKNARYWQKRVQRLLEEKEKQSETK